MILGYDCLCLCVPHLSATTYSKPGDLGIKQDYLRMNVKGRWEKKEPGPWRAEAGRSD